MTEVSNQLEELVKTVERLEKRLQWLATEYQPCQDCIDSEFNCDFIVDDSNECPCQWALKLDPDCIEKVMKK